MNLNLNPWWVVGFVCRRRRLFSSKLNPAAQNYAFKLKFRWNLLLCSTTETRFYYKNLLEFFVVVK